MCLRVWVLHLKYNQRVMREYTIKMLGHITSRRRNLACFSMPVLKESYNLHRQTELFYQTFIDVDSTAMLKVYRNTDLMVLVDIIAQYQNHIAR